MHDCRVAIVGNPNVGKTSLFNHLTHSRYSVGNYPGITVEVRKGRVGSELTSDRPMTAIDLPGIYSTTALSEDEALAFGVLSGDDRPDAVVVVVDATNLARNLYLVLQIRELGLSCVVALNMVDLARESGMAVNAAGLSKMLGVPVLPTIARSGEGSRAVVDALFDALEQPCGRRIVDATPDLGELVEAERRFAQAAKVEDRARARWLLSAHVAGAASLRCADGEQRVLDSLGAARCEAAVQQLVALRYARVDEILAGTLPATTRAGDAPAMARSEKIDRLLTHPVWGFVTFIGVMAVLFQLLFTWSDPLVGLIEAGVGALTVGVRATFAAGLFTDLLTDGVIAGVGNVIVFVPQIALLFLVIGLLEDSGYLARAAFLIDRLMAKSGLSGKAFVPLLSGYACSIPAIMSTRTIVGFRDRVVTILMIPYMSCSARLPVYALIIAALFDADVRVLGPFTVGGLLLLSMYLLSTGSALAVGIVCKRTILRGPTPPFVLELPPYRRPRLRSVLMRVYDRTLDFVRDAGTIILAVTIVLWGLLTFPRVEPHQLAEGETAIEYSVAGRAGKLLEPALEPIGQDWRIGIGLIGSFAAREVLISTLGLVYGIENVEQDETPLRETFRNAKDPKTGKRRYTPLKGLALMVFFVYACQCMSTLAVVRRETCSWRWPVFMFLSMTSIAYVMALLVYQGGRFLGFE
ncbi:MAG: ferrous iron transport protein B [Nannocystaceae bacterium]